MTKTEESNHSFVSAATQLLQNHYPWLSCQQLEEWLAKKRTEESVIELFHGNGLLIENSAAIAENLKIYSKINVVCTFAECGVPLMTSFHPLRLYIGRRFMYDFSLDYKTEVIRFMQAFYGKAYAEMEALRRMIVEENASVEKMSLNCPVRLRSNLNTAFFEKAEKLFETAWKKAGNDK